MKRLCQILITLIILVGCSAVEQKNAENPGMCLLKSPDKKAGELLLSFDSLDSEKDVSREAVDVLRASGFSVDRYKSKIVLRSARRYWLELSGLDIPADRIDFAVATLQTAGFETSANHIVRALTSDPYYSSTGSWGQAYDDMWALKSIHPDGAWTVTKGAGITVAVIDTGVDYNHPELQGRVILGPNYTAMAGTPEASDPMDDHGHGTHVAGIIASEGENSVGVVGIAPETQILAIKVLDENGSGSSSQLISGIQYAIDNGADVINMSLGFDTISNTVIREAIVTAHNSGLIVVAAAGNSYADVETAAPAHYPQTISVGSYDVDGNRSIFSNYGQGLSISGPGGGEPGVSASNVLSLRSSMVNIFEIPAYLNVGNATPGNQLLRLQGTSMSAPFVAGVAALVLAAHPSYTNEQVRQAIQSSAQRGNAFSEDFGYGKVDATGAVNALAPLEPFISNTDTVTTFSCQGTLLPISGRVKGPNLKEWSLQYSFDHGASWKEITKGTSSVPQSTLRQWDGGICGNVDVGATIGGNQVVLKLVATKQSGESYEFRKPIRQFLNGLPVAPFAVTAKNAEGGGVTLQWTPGSFNTEQFEIFRSDSPDTGFTSMGTTRERYYTDSSGSPAMFYRVIALNEKGASGYSRSLSVLTSPTASGSSETTVQPTCAK